MSKESDEALAAGFGLFGFAIFVILIVLGWRWAVHKIHSYPTTYCTAWTRAVSIEPTNHDNGKYSDEQYIVRYADGSLDGQSQGDIPFARCTHKVKTTAKKESSWKTVGSLGYVDWEE
jgi:hypothetical protein